MPAINFTQLLLHNAEFLRPFAITLTRDSEEAKDLFQETLYRALVNEDKYSIGTNVKAWLYTIMRNIFINSYRKKSKQNIVADASANEFLLNSAKTTTANDAIASLSMQEIHKAINNLPEIFKIPFTLHYEGFKYDEIAGLLREPLGTIKSRIHFARKLLKVQIDHY
jgi:RNA polymerase sigma-70 factor (ECF subfamily)